MPNFVSGGNLITSAGQVNANVIATAAIQNGAVTEVKTSFAADLITNVAEDNMEIIELQANATLTPITHAAVIVDTFSDNTGYNNYVDTGNTTSTFSTNKYIGTEAIDKQFTGGSANPWNSESGNHWVSTSFTTIGAIICNKIEFGLAKNVAPTGNITCYIYAASLHLPTGAALGTSTNVVAASGLGTSEGYSSFTFNNISLSAATTYCIVVTSSVAADAVNNIDIFFGSSSGYKYGISADGSSWGTGSADSQLDFKLYGLAANSIIQINLPTISGTVTHTELVTNNTGSGTTTYALVDASANQDTGLAVTTKNALVTLVSNPTILKIKLVSNTAQCKTYALKLWKS